MSGSSGMTMSARAAPGAGAPMAALRLEPGLEPGKQSPGRLDLVRALLEAVLLAREDDVLGRHAFPFERGVQLVGLRLRDPRVLLALEDQRRRAGVGDPPDRAGVAAQILVV